MTGGAESTPEGLASQVATLAVSTQQLADTVGREGMYRRQDRRRFVITMRVLAGFGVVLALMLAGVLWIGLVNREGVARVKDCTTDGGKCKQRGEQDVAKAVSNIVLQQTAQAVKLSVVQRSCLRADPNLSDEQLESCVFGKLAARTGR